MTENPSLHIVAPVGDISIITETRKETRMGAYFKCPCCQTPLKIPIEYYESGKRITLSGVEKDD